MPSQRVRFTKRSVEAVRPPASGNRHVRDTETRGLELIVTAGGCKTFYLSRKVNGRSQRARIGQFPDVTVEQARRQAAVFNGKIAKGEDPNAQRQAMKAEATFGALFDTYLENYAKAHKRTWAEDERMYNHHLAGWRNRQLREIRKADVADLHAKVGKKAPYAANRLLSLLLKLFNYAVDERGWDGANPCRGIRKFKERKRMRYLEAAELRRFFKALAAEPSESYRDYFLLLLITGARRSNVGAMRWADVDLERGVWTVPGEESKNGEQLQLVLSAAALGILKRRAEKADGDFVFPSRYTSTEHVTEHKRAWSRVMEAAKLKDVRPHDLRRTLAVYQNLIGSSPLVIRDSLGQKSLQALDHYAHSPDTLVRKSVEAAGKAMLKHGGKKLLEAAK